MSEKNHSEQTSNKQITALILAGGRGQRLGGQDKGLVEVQQQPLIAYVIQAIQAEVAHIIISANRNQDRYAEFGYPVYSDSLSGYMGPLAGILTGLQQCTTPWLLVLPADTPRLPQRLISRLWQAVQNQPCQIAIAAEGDYLQPTFAIINVLLRDSLQQYLQNGGRKTQQWMQQQTHCRVDFSDQADAFMNINTEAELAIAQQQFKP